MLIDTDLITALFLWHLHSPLSIFNLAHRRLAPIPNDMKPRVELTLVKLACKWRVPGMSYTHDQAYIFPTWDFRTATIDIPSWLRSWKESCNTFFITCLLKFSSLLRLSYSKHPNSLGIGHPMLRSRCQIAMDRSAEAQLVNDDREMTTMCISNCQVNQKQLLQVEKLCMCVFFTVQL